MDVIYRNGVASAQEVHAAIPDPPSYSSVRTLLGILIEKGHLRRRKSGIRYVYVPTTAQGQAAKGELLRVLKTFFNGSVESAVQTLISEHEQRLTDEELDRLARLIAQAKEGGR